MHKVEECPEKMYRYSEHGSLHSPSPSQQHMRAPYSACKNVRNRLFLLWGHPLVHTEGIETPVPCSFLNE